MKDPTQGMSEHTPEPWVLEQVSGAPLWHVEDLAGNPIAVAEQRTNARVAFDFEREANALRIVACVNACAGIETSALESGVVQEMREALQAAYDVVEKAADKEDGVGPAITAAELIHAVLSKLEPSR